MKHTFTYNHQSQFIEMFGNPLFSTREGAITLGEATDIILGSTPDSKNESYWAGELCWITPAELSEDSFEVNDTERHISYEGVKATNLTGMPIGTVLFSTRAPIGKVAITTTLMYCNQGFKNMYCKENLNNVFLYYTLKFNKAHLQSLGTGTTFKELSKKIIESINIFIPEIERQKQFEAIYRQADKSKFDGFKSQFIEMFGTVENNLHQYSVKTIGDIAECFAGATPSTSISEYWENGTIRWMSSGEVHNGHIHDTESRITELGYRKASTKMVPIHSVVIALAGQGKTRGTVAVTEVELCTNQSLCAIVPNGKVHYEYLYHNLNGRYIELRGMSGDVNGRGGLNLRIIQSIPIIVPPFELQQQFADIVNQADKSKYYVQNKLNIICHILTNQIQLRRCS